MSHRCYCGLQTIAKQLRNMADFESKDVQMAAEMPRYQVEMSTFVQDNNFLNSNKKHLS